MTYTGDDPDVPLVEKLFVMVSGSKCLKSFDEILENSTPYTGIIRPQDDPCFLSFPWASSMQVEEFVEELKTRLPELDILKWRLGTSHDELTIMLDLDLENDR